MKDCIRAKSTSHSVLFLLFVSIGAFAPAQALAKKSETVKLEITGSGVLEMKSESKCPMITGNRPRPNFPEKGCVRAPQSEELELTFTLSGQTSNPACPHPARYVLDGIQLGGKNDLKPTTAQWENPAALLDADVQADFVVDPVSGWVNFTRDNNGDIVLQDYNKSAAGYWIWYRVRASCNNPNNPNPIYYDPRVDNEGTPPS